MRRRQFLRQSASVAGLSFIGCGIGVLPACSQQAHGARRELRVAGKRIQTVDIHCHSYVHDVWPLIEQHGQLDYLASVVENPVIRERIDINNVDYRLQQMDEQGIDVQALSLHVGQYHHWADEDLASKIVSTQNEKIAETCAAHPDRFVGIGAVSLQHPQLAAQQMRHAVDELDMRGFMITGSVNDEELSDPKFHPFWAEAEALGTVIFIHPRNFPAGQTRLNGNGRLDNVIGNPLETTVALSHLIFEGTLDKFPGIKICAAHGGGYLASYIGRSDHCIEHAAMFCDAVEKLPSEYLKQLYFDSLLYTTENLRHLIATVGADRVVIGSDFPFAMGNKQAIDHVMSVDGLSDEQLASVLGNTAAALLGIS